MRLYRYFMGGMPWYLARYYWWAYLWRPAIWFFDHQTVINAILFGQYKALMRATLERMRDIPAGKSLQLTCVYGMLTSKLIGRLAPDTLHITDVSHAQLELARRKQIDPECLRATRMNAERLGYRSNAFSTVVIFFLLHEMPPEARRHTLSECLRVLSPGGTLLITEYAPTPFKHWLYRIVPLRALLTRLEPFLGSFWQEDIPGLLTQLGRPLGKNGELVSDRQIFSGFYAVTQYRIVQAV